MTRLYLDTSLLVAALVHERGTATAHCYLQDKADHGWQISCWVVSELASALGLKCRQTIITASEAADIWQRFQVLERQRLQVLTPESADFQAAARFCLSPTTPLKAGDALHLAICQRQNSCLVSFDRQLHAAAMQHGVSTQLLQIPD